MRDFISSFVVAGVVCALASVIWAWGAGAAIVVIMAACLACEVWG